MLWLMIWIAFGIVCALAAKPRGRNPAVWFFLGVLFGPFALVAVLVMPAVSSAQME